MKTKTTLTTFCVITALFITACTTPVAPPVATTEPINMNELRTEIQKMEDAYAAAEKAKDAEGVMAYYSEDIVNYNRNEEPTIGKASLKEKVAERLAADTTGNYDVYQVVDLFAEGKMAVEVGSWTVFSPAGEEVKKGYYMSYFEKRDGKYVCVRDMNISSAPEIVANPRIAGM